VPSAASRTTWSISGSAAPAYAAEFLVENWFVAHLERLAELLRQRNAVESEIAQILGRPATHGHLGEYVASQVFGIALELSATSKGIDGRFTRGPLKDRSVDVKWYGKREGVLDLPAHDVLPDFYLVMTGPQSAAATSRGATRPWCVASVFLFEAASLFDRLRQRGVKIGVATSVAAQYWTEAEIYPDARSPLLMLIENEREALRLFAPEPR
jgi:hypothetical protein